MTPATYNGIPTRRRQRCGRRDVNNIIQPGKTLTIRGHVVGANVHHSNMNVIIAMLLT